MSGQSEGGDVLYVEGEVKDENWGVSIKPDTLIGVGE